MVLNQEEKTAEKIKTVVRELLQDESRRRAMGLSLQQLLPTHIAERLVDILQERFFKTKTS